MPWQHLEQGEIAGLPLDLYEKDGEYMIRVDGLELMNSHCHGSEVALARLTREAVTEAAAPRVLIGGLGLGYTLAACLAELGARARLEVVEKSPDLLRWYQRYFRAKAVGHLDDSSVAFRCQDVVEMLRAADQGAYDAIILDVDNGPEPVSGAGNGWLYREEGLRQIHACLSRHGALLLWSGFASEAFSARAGACGFHVECVAIDLPAPGHQHFVFVCRRTVMAATAST